MLAAALMPGGGLRRYLCVTGRPGRRFRRCLYPARHLRSAAVAAADPGPDLPEYLPGAAAFVAAELQAFFSLSLFSSLLDSRSVMAYISEVPFLRTLFSLMSDGTPRLQRYCLFGAVCFRCVLIKCYYMFRLSLRLLTLILPTLTPELVVAASPASMRRR